MSDGMGRELAYLSSHATNRYFIPNWGNDSSENSLDKDFVPFSIISSEASFATFLHDEVSNKESNPRNRKQLLFSFIEFSCIIIQII